MMELLIFMSTLFYRYDFKLTPEFANRDELEITEGFLRKVRFSSFLSNGDGH